MKMKIRKWLAIPLMLCLIFVLAACDADDDADNINDNDAIGGGGGLAGTATVEGDGLPPVDDNLNENEALPTPDIATEVMTATATTVAATPEMTATEIMTDTDTITDTDTMTDTDMTGESMDERAIIQAGELIDMTIVDENNEEFGQVAEVLIDEQGMIQYVLVDDLEDLDDAGEVDDTDAVTDTTELDDLDADYIVLTWEDLSFEQDMETDEVDDGRLVINAEALAAVDTMATVDDAILDADVSVIEDDPDDDVEVPAEYVGLLKVRQFNDYNLVNLNDEDLGEVEELLIDTADGVVVYLIADVGGFLGIGESQVAIPWDRVEFRTDLDDAGAIDETFFVLDTNEETLEGAPTIDLDDWNPFVEDEDWDAVYSDFWDTNMPAS